MMSRPREVAARASSAGKLNFSSAGVGTPGHLAGLLCNKQASIDVVHIAQKGDGAGHPGTAGQGGRYPFRQIRNGANLITAMNSLRGLRAGAGAGHGGLLGPRHGRATLIIERE